MEQGIGERKSDCGGKRRRPEEVAASLYFSHEKVKHIRRYSRHIRTADFLK